MLTIRWSPLAVMILLTSIGAAAQRDPERKDWVQLFNRKNLDGWIVKLAGHELGDNYADTFRVENGLLKVSYDKYDEYENRFGHLFYRERLSHYIVAVEYRFVGEQARGGPNYAGFDPAIKKDGTVLKDGYIGLQSESQPIDFRKVELLNLSGCMDPKAANYKSYYVHRDDSRCVAGKELRP